MKAKITLALIGTTLPIVTLVSCGSSNENKSAVNNAFEKNNIDDGNFQRKWKVHYLDNGIEKTYIFDWVWWYKNTWGSSAATELQSDLKSKIMLEKPMSRLIAMAINIHNQSQYSNVIYANDIISIEKMGDAFRTDPDDSNFISYANFWFAGV